MNLDQFNDQQAANAHYAGGSHRTKTEARFILSDDERLEIKQEGDMGTDGCPHNAIYRPLKLVC